MRVLKTQLRAWRRAAIALPAVVLAMSGSAAAAQVRGGDTVIVDADEVIEDDLFLSGNQLEMNGTVRGDLFAAGNQVVVNGQVERRWGGFWALVLGAVVYEILRAMPILGWLVWLAVTLVGLGAIHQALRNRWSAAKAPAQIS